MIKFKNDSYLYLILSISILSGAYFIEYVMGHKPCPLCVYERIPYFSLIISSLIAIKYPSRYMNLVISIIFFGSFMLGIYHTGVEEGIFAGLEGCNSRLDKVVSTTEEMKELIFKDPAPSCAHAEFRILSFSLASWNAMISIILSFISFKNFRKK